MTFAAHESRHVAVQAVPDPSDRGICCRTVTIPVGGSAVAAVSDISMAAMPDGMRCCPDEKPAVPDCQKTCPLTAMCGQDLLHCPTLSKVALVLQGTGDAIRPHSDAWGEARTIEPPARPPRIWDIAGTSVPTRAALAKLGRPRARGCATTSPTIYLPGGNWAISRPPFIFLTSLTHSSGR